MAPKSLKHLLLQVKKLKSLFGYAFDDENFVFNKNKNSVLACFCDD